MRNFSMPTFNFCVGSVAVEWNTEISSLVKCVLIHFCVLFIAIICHEILTKKGSKDQVKSVKHEE